MTEDVLAVFGVGKKKKIAFRRKASGKGYSMAEAVRTWIDQFMRGELVLPEKKEE